MTSRRARRPVGADTGWCKSVKLKGARTTPRPASVRLRLDELAALLVLVALALLVLAAPVAGSASPHASRRGARRLQGAATARGPTSEDSADPMEPCYLAHNRASETLTISESTPVGTIVGELMVNGDSSENGTIDLSITMPGGGAAPSHADTPLAHVALSTPSSHPDTPSLAHPAGGAPQADSAGLSDDDDYLRQASGRRHTSTHPEGVVVLARGRAGGGGEGEGRRLGAGGDGERRAGGSEGSLAEMSRGRPKTARDLSYLIDLMPPLSIEQGTKRLILAKKLDRENLDKYMGSYQSSIGSPSQSTASASLTVHIKCQLRETTGRDIGPSSANVPALAAAAATATASNSSLGSNGTAPGLDRASKLLTRKFSPSQTKRASQNSILIPIHLIVTDENDNWPNFIGWPYIIDLNESAPVGSLLQGNEILAVDNDQQGPLSTIEYSIVAGSFWSDSFGFLNPLDSRSLIVKDNRLFDYENQSKLTLKVMARDQGEPPNWAITSLYINLLDQDDLSPVFGEDKYFGSIKENRAGEKIDLLPRRLTAQDGDKTLAAPVSYSFHRKTNHSIHFDLDPDLGQLSLRKALPEIAPHGARQHSTFCLLVRASQVDNPQRFSVTAVSLKLALAKGAGAATPMEPIARESPKFAHSNYTVEVSEAALVGSTILTASANHHADELVHYQLLDNDSAHLNIDRATGRLTLNKSLDYEMFRHLSVRILATIEQSANRRTEPTGESAVGSGGYLPRLACDIARVNINVINHNDYTPEFSHEQYNFQLSISDLIANFEPAARLRADPDNGGGGGGGGSSPQSSPGDKMSHRFGEIELDESGANDELDYRAIQLGQVYCADRDFGDRVSLRLSGSKAALFQLTQDGRLYLPLVNVTTPQLMVDDAQRAAVGSGDKQRPSVSREWDPTKAPNGVINNQLSMSRAFAWTARRSDSGARKPDDHNNNNSNNDDDDAETLDRSYLNHLLNELSNLGRLRLKVHATDNGQPEAKHSTALVVVSIVSIDNFIIQRAPTSQMVGELVPGSEGPIRGESSTPGGANEPTAGGDSDLSMDKRLGQQLMMIPSMNGREFVHINPEIIGNLLSASSGRNLSGQAVGPATESLSGRRSAMSDALEPSASSTVLSSLRPHDSALGPTSALVAPTTPARQHQPPGLLLVDDGGAKFVAMPAAIEVYNQQVQEAAGQQARQKQAKLDRQSARGVLGGSTGGGGLWSAWAHKLGLGQSDAWTSLPATILVHALIVLALIGLAARIRSLVPGSRANSGLEGLSAGFDADGDGAQGRWPRRLSNLSSFFAPKSSGGDSASDILNQHQSSASVYGNVAASLSGGGGAGGGSAGLQYSGYVNQLHEHARSEEPSPRARDQRQGAGDVSRCHARHQPGVVSSGVVVSAMSNATRLEPTQSRLAENCAQASGGGGGETSAEAKSQQQQQNLFDHLKLTLNRMMDTSEEQQQVGQVSVRPLDSDVVAFEDQRDRALDDRAQYRETSELQLNQQQQQQHERSAISTFIGAGGQQVSQRSPAQASARNQAAAAAPAAANSNVSRPDKGPCNSTLVSIHVVAPNGQQQLQAPLSQRVGLSESKSSAGRPEVELARTQAKADRNSSSSSSVVSLVSSAGSSLSNKISEAVSRAENEQVAGTSDASSLDSSILLQGCPNPTIGRMSSDDHRHHHHQQQQQHHHHQHNEHQRARLPLSTSKPPAPPPLPPPPPSQIRAHNSGRVYGAPSVGSPRCPDGLVIAASCGGKSEPGRCVAALPENPVHARLKHESQPPQDSSGARGQAQPSAGTRADLRGSLSSRQPAHKSSAPSVVGRREARGQANLIAKAPSRHPAHASGPGANSNETTSASGGPAIGSQKTVSPATSVDRGYESFQSCEQPRGQLAPTGQFSSLQDYEPSARVLPARDCGGHFVGHGAQVVMFGVHETKFKSAKGSLATSQTEQRKRTHQAYQASQPPLATCQASQTLRSAAARSGPRRVRTASERERRSQAAPSKTDCDTEDDDFYYCCSELAHADDARHQLPALAGGLLSEYASHTYRQSSQPTRTKPMGTRHASVRHPKGANSTLDDLILYPCEYQQQQQQRADMSQVCDTSPQRLLCPAAQQFAYEQRRHTHQQPRAVTLSRDRLQAQPGAGATRHRLPSGQVGHSSQTLLADLAYPSASKKQLTWSDQVEMDSY